MKHLETAKRAFYRQTHNLESRALRECRGHSQNINTFVTNGVDQRAIDKLDSLFVKYLHANARCANWFITGSANFDSARNEKKLNIAMRRGIEYDNFVAKVLQAKNRTPLIVQGQAGNLERLQRLLVTAKAQHKHLLDNPQARKHSYSLTYARKHVKDLEQKIAIEQKLSTVANMFDAVTIEGVTIEWDSAAGRCKLLFNGRISKETAAQLKKYGFKYARTVEAWQRFTSMNTQNLMAQQVIPWLKSKNGCY